MSRTDDVAAAAAGTQLGLDGPVIVSKQSSTTFSDKEQIWADNAASSPYFGNVYVCWASFRSNSEGQRAADPADVARSHDGGNTWTTKQVGPATDNGNNAPARRCTVRTDSHGQRLRVRHRRRGGQKRADDVQVHRRWRALGPGPHSSRRGAAGRLRPGARPARDGRHRRCARRPGAGAERGHRQRRSDRRRTPPTRSS